MTKIALSKEKVINQARHYVSLAPLNSHTMESAEIQYDLIKASMLQERPWPFTIALSRDIQATTQGEDLGYSYKYRLPVDALGVITINPNQRYLVSAGSNHDRIRIGLAPVDDQPISNLVQEHNYFVKEGILHSNIEVDEILYQKEPKEKDFTVDFMLALSWNLAKFFAISVSNDGQLAAYCANEAETYHAKAMKGLTRMYPSIPARAFTNWVRLYYGSMYT